MLLLGIDLGTSSIKVSVVDGESCRCIASAQYPELEVKISVPQPGWAEQSPTLWWEHVQQAILKCHASGLYDPNDIGAIGISYQMHGLVVVDRDQNVLRDAIIWCDGRAIGIGERAFAAMGEEYCVSSLLNSPGNFTASKLGWVKENEPDVFARIDKVLLPGDFIAMKFTGEPTTTISALSEGTFWDFKEGRVSVELMNYFGFNSSLIPEIRDVFSSHGSLSESVAQFLLLKTGIPVSYKAGDQLNNALSLNVINPGEVAATAGTSGVIYGISNKLAYDLQSRINSFAHVNHQQDDVRIGVLLCINGTGISNRWVRDVTGGARSYEEMNALAARVPAGAEGLCFLPFGNGPERMLRNRLVGAHLDNVDLNLHSPAHIIRAVQEGIAFAFRFGLDIMRENGIEPSIIRAGRANMFLSEVFTQTFVDSTCVPVEIYNTDGSIGAALGAGVGLGYYYGLEEAMGQFTLLKTVEPVNTRIYDDLYSSWKEQLEDRLYRDQTEQKP